MRDPLEALVQGLAPDIDIARDILGVFQEVVGLHLIQLFDRLEFDLARGQRFELFDSGEQLVAGRAHFVLHDPDTLAQNSDRLVFGVEVAL